MITPRLCPRLLFFVCFLLACAGLSAQEMPETVETASSVETADPTENFFVSPRHKPREPKLYIDIPLAIAEISIINLAGNFYWRLWGPDSESAYFTLDSIRNNLNPQSWHWEAGPGGDTFLVNQLFHPYAGGFYFTSARSNNLNFYVSILGPFLGSVQWETFAETEMPAKNDLITTFSGGIILGEILHRLYLELDKGGIAGKIAATILSPPDRVTAALRGYGPEEGPGKINSASLAFGVSWLSTWFFETDDETIKWNTPSFFLDFDLVYGDSFTAHSKTPFEQFDLNLSLALAIPQLYNFSLMTGGYLASWLLADDEMNQASNGLTLNFDAYVTDKGFMDLNNGRENLSFSATSLDYGIKWRRVLNESFDFSLNCNLGFSPWAVAGYNGGEETDDYNLFVMGGNIKLFMELRQIKNSSSTKNTQALALDLCFYDAWHIPKTPNFDVNVIFFSSKISYSFPLSGRISFYAADTFQLLNCRPDINAGEAFFPDITRLYNNAQLGLKVSLK